MEVEHSKVRDMCRTINNNMLHMGSKDNSQRAENQGQRRSQSFKEKMLSFMGERKTEKEKQAKIEKEIKLGSSKKTEDSRKKKVQQEQPLEERNLKNK